MKVVFPRSGSLVLLKQDLETLKAFYNTNLLTSQMLEIYKRNNSMVQIKNFNYIPENNSLVLDNANFLTIDEMREILGLSTTNISNKSKNTSIPTNQNQENEYISDDDILSNPFFTTLTPIN